jgi:hypothetical protein
MSDIREQVKEDRGLLKKIQNVIPGFRGYRKREDVRAADSILRLQMADGLVRVRDGLEEARRVMTEDYQTGSIDKVGSVINKSRTLEGKVRHAEQGYSGFSPAIRIEEDELNRLYEYDAHLISAIKHMDEAQADLISAIHGRDETATRSSLNMIDHQLVEFERVFEERIPRVAGIYNM